MQVTEAPKEPKREPTVVDWDEAIRRNKAMLNKMYRRRGHAR
jgi:hypothetical protein